MKEDEDLQHLRNLLVEHKRYLRIVEQQIAAHGRLNAPPSLIRQEEITKEAIHEVSQRIRRRIKCVDDDSLLYSEEELDAIVDKFLEIHKLELRSDSLIASREELKRIVRGFYPIQRWRIIHFCVALLYALFFSFLLIAFSLNLPDELFLSGGSVLLISLVVMCLFSLIWSIKMGMMVFSGKVEFNVNKKGVDFLSREVIVVHQIISQKKAELNDTYKIEYPNV